MTNSFNISDIHNETLKFLRDQKIKYKDKYDKRILELEEIIKVNPKEIKLAKSEIQKLNEKLTIKEERINKYLAETKPLLDEYKKLISKTIIGQRNDEIDIITEKYIDIVNRYKIIRIDRPASKICPKCFRHMEIVNEAYFHCNKCDCFEDYMDYDINIKKNTDARLKCFLEAIQSVQGKEYNIPKQDIIDQIQTFMKTKKITIKRKKDVRDILGTLKLTNYKSHANYIFSYMTKKPLLEIPKPIEDNVIERYNIFMGIYDLIDKNRSNSIKNQHLLYYFLKMEGMELDKDDFDLIKTKDSEIECNEIILRICNILNKFTSMKWSFEP